ncbi:MAG TPA: complex I subunit 1 family protein [bacterium]|jgi:NADH-quinone oxidoreductase subunit H|nr:complex I subunit 1 family protein [bacterium]
MPDLDSSLAFLTAHPFLIQLAAALVKTIFMMTVVMLIGGLILSWVERKQSAIMQDRIGANRASILGVRAMGLIHNLADAAKGVLKEDFIPPQANPFLHTLAPFLAVCTAVVAFSVLPFGGDVSILGQHIPLTIAPLPVGILFVWAMMGMGVYGVILAGYVSNNKYSMLGCLRASAQVISYEVATGLTILGALVFYHSVDLRDMVQWQMVHSLNQVPGLSWMPAWVPAWGVFLQPVGFILFFTATIVEMKRIPFDLPEGESEIIGYSIEYSGMKFMIFMMSEFVESLLFAWVVVLIFFGGWHVPGLSLPDQMGMPATLGILGVHSLPYAAGVALETAAMALKIIFFLWLQMLVRWSLPRFRYDQIMHLGWKIMLPLALVNLVVTAGLCVLLK